MSSSYSDKSTKVERQQAAAMAAAIANFKGPVKQCKAYMPKKKRNPVGGR